MSTSQEWLNSDSSINTNPLTSIKGNSRHSVNLYISPATTSNIKMGSPLTNRNLKNCLSFASIKQHKIIHEMQTPKNSQKKLKPHQKQNKQNTNIIKQRQTLTGVKQKQKNVCPKTEDESSKIVLQSYKMQTESLKETVSILKQQIEALTYNNKLLKEQHKNLQVSQAAQQQKIQNLQQQLQKSKKKEAEYESIVPKIEQLEQLQDRMIEDNAKVKQREMLLRELLAEVVVLVGGKYDETAVIVRQTISSRLSG